MHFDWDDAKDWSNHEKHGVWFEEAQTVWANDRAVEFFDPDHGQGEDRFIRIGYSTTPRLLLVVFCEHEDYQAIRIISARKATRKESDDYEKGI